MGRFMSGIVLGSVVGAIGLTYAMSDKRMRKHMVRDSRRMINRASRAITHMSDML